MSIQSITLDRLRPDPENVRKTRASLHEDEEMKASIRAHGLLENLVVRDDGNGGFLVSSGVRRLAAMAALRKSGDLPADHPVNCLVVENGDAAEVSLAENLIRSEMHPADQVVAFVALSKGGMSNADIGARFGVAERIVAQRVRLGNVHPTIMKAYRRNEIDIRSLHAFATSPDPKRQLKVWRSLDSWMRDNSHQVKQRLREGHVDGTDKRAQFVGVAAYEAAGGRTERDIFADEESLEGIVFLDVKRLDKLAEEKLAAEAERIASEEGWKWAAARPEGLSWRDEEQYGQLNKRPPQYTEEQQTERSKLDEKMVAITKRIDESDGDDVDEGLHDQHAKLLRRDRDIVQSASFGPRQKQKGGAIVTLNHEGGVVVKRGLVRPEDGGKRAASGSNKPKAQSQSTKPGQPGYVSPGEKARKDQGFSQQLADDLSWVRVSAVKVAVAKDFEAAFDLLTFEMCAALVRSSSGYHHGDLSLRIENTGTYPKGFNVDEDAWKAKNPVIGELQALIDDLPLDWLDLKEPGKSWIRYKDLTLQTKYRLFSAMVALSVRRSLYLLPLDTPLEDTIERLRIDFSRIPASRELLWNSVPKAQALEQAAAVLGDEWVKENKKLKKAELVQALDEAFREIDGYTIPGLAPNYLPKG